MSSKRRCPECNQWLAISGTDCSCGWKKTKSNEKTAEDYRCQYEISGRRCPLFGTNSLSIYGRSSWYCCEHWQNLSDSALCEAILLNAEKEFERIIEERIDWRRRLFQEDFKIKKKL